MKWFDFLFLEAFPSVLPMFSINFFAN